MIYIECFVILICFIVVVFVMFWNNQSYPPYNPPPRENFSVAAGPLNTSRVDDLFNLEKSDHPIGYDDADSDEMAPPANNLIQTDSDDEDSDLEESPVKNPAELDVKLEEDDGQVNYHVKVVNPLDLPITHRVVVKVPGYDSLFDIHNQQDCCSTATLPLQSKYCTTKTVTGPYLQESDKKYNPSVKNNTCSGDDHSVDPAGVLCHSKEPAAIPIEYSPDSCLPSQLSKNISNKNDCFNPDNLVYTPEPVDPIDYTVRKGILNPPDDKHTYVQAVVDPHTNSGYAMDFH